MKEKKNRRKVVGISRVFTEYGIEKGPDPEGAWGLVSSPKF